MCDNLNFVRAGNEHNYYLLEDGNIMVLITKCHVIHTNSNCPSIIGLFLPLGVAKSIALARAILQWEWGRSDGHPTATGQSQIHAFPGDRVSTNPELLGSYGRAPTTSTKYAIKNQANENHDIDQWWGVLVHSTNRHSPAAPSAIPSATCLTFGYGIPNRQLGNHLLFGTVRASEYATSMLFNLHSALNNLCNM